MESFLASQLLQTLIEDFRFKLALNPSRNTLSRTNDPLDNIQVSLDEEIKVAELSLEAVTSVASKKLTTLRLQRNSLSIIYRIPNEIISYIFSLTIDQERFDGFPKRSTLLALSSVSHLWREVMLDEPKFWNGISMLPKGLIPLFIARSKTAPLDIVISHDTDEDHTKYLPLVSPHIGRWRHCDLIHIEPEKIVSYLQAPAPLLEGLTIARRPRNEDPDFAVDIKDSIPTIFGGVTPNLRNLTLAAVCIPFAHTIFTGLMELRLSFIEYTQPESLVNFLQVLELCPLLEVLTLEEISFNFPIELVPPAHLLTPVIKQSHLRYLSILYPDYLWAPRHILSRIITSPSTHFTLFANLQGDQNLGTILPEITPSQINLRNLASAWELSLRQEPHPRWGEGHYVVRIWASVFEYTTARRKVVTPIFEVDLDGDNQLPSRIFPSLDRYVQTPRLVKLVFHLPFEQIEPALFVDFLARHPGLKSIYLFRVPDDILQLLISTPERHLCPKLKRLVFMDCPFSEANLVAFLESRIAYRGNDGPPSVTAPLELLIGLCPNIPTECTARFEGQVVSRHYTLEAAAANVPLNAEMVRQWLYPDGLDVDRT